MENENYKLSIKRIKKVIEHCFLFLIIALLYFYFYTPPHEIIFYDIDSRRNIDEVIQIFKASSFYDLLFDVFFGNMIHYGRIFQILLFMFSVPVKLLFNLEYHYVVHISHFLITFISLLIIVNTLIKEKIIQYFSLISLMLIDLTSNIMIKTTSVELLIIAVFLYLIKNPIKKFEFIQYAVLGILVAVKFTNIIYPAVYFFLRVKTIKNFDLLKIILWSLLGFFIGQPITFTKYGFNWYANWIKDTLNYDEGYTVGYIDWINLIVQNYSGQIIFIFLLIGLVINLKNKIAFDEMFKFLIFSSIFQIFAFTFSNSLIRSHYLKLPIVLIFISSLLLLKNKKFLILIYVTLFLSFNMVNFINKSENYPNIAKYENYEHFKDALEESDEYIAQNYILNYILNNFDLNNNQLVWWSGQKIFPYSNFHWGSTEVVTNEKYYLREVWGPSLEFSLSNCADYGGIAVLLTQNSQFVELKNNMNKKGFNYEFNYELPNSEKGYYVFKSLENQLPYSC
jgi:hypothetical protein